ncbi:hypothetical protein PL9214100015 [Planktothrix tepida PCC 9214]|uniref:Uncharacterized protein n=1 Tax=Planktothrix tepida PCC 9214 TaxID=671072 RepID=A0A1J1LCH8_9CYAN|nr:hypothetical protein PL9214100015 [Planktothrix tepida PCC 9214]
MGSAAFNPSEATLDDLKRYVRTYQPDDTENPITSIRYQS